MMGNPYYITAVSSDSRKAEIKENISLKDGVFFPGGKNQIFETKSGATLMNSICQFKLR